MADGRVKFSVSDTATFKNIHEFFPVDKNRLHIDLYSVAVWNTLADSRFVFSFLFRDEIVVLSFLTGGSPFFDFGENMFSFF